MKSIYDLQISNDSKSASDCSLALEPPASGVSVEPRSLSLRSHEVRTVTVIFAADALPGGSGRVVMTVRDGADALQATFEQSVALTPEDEPIRQAGAGSDLPLFTGQAAPLATRAAADGARKNPAGEGDAAVVGMLTEQTQLALTFPVGTPSAQAATPPKTPATVARTYRSVYTPQPRRQRTGRLGEVLVVALALVGIVLAAILLKPVSLHALPSLARATIGRALAHVAAHRVARPTHRAAAIHTGALHPRTRLAGIAKAASLPAPVLSSPPQALSKQSTIQGKSKRTHQLAAPRTHANSVALSIPITNEEHASGGSLTAPPADPTALSPAQRQSIARAELKAKQPRISPVAAPVVSVEGLEARYSPAGRSVRIDWSAGGQASAHLVLIDSRGAGLTSLTVPGAQHSARLNLPALYRGGVVVQLTSTGRLGERVVETVSLPPFSR